MATTAPAVDGDRTEKDLPDNDGSRKEADEHESSASETRAEGKEEAEQYPQGVAFAMIMTSVLSSLFLVALVILRTMHIISPPRELTTFPGPNNRRDGRPGHH